MGIVHPGSELTPTKAELLEQWLPAQGWWPGGEVPPFVASFRLDDPAGDVGIETFLLPVGDRTVHVPVTYRAEPLASGVLVGEMEHSALGHRWVYDGPSDPVYVAETSAAIREGRGEVALLAPDGSPIPRRPTTAAVTGSGAGEGDLHVVRVISAETPPSTAGTLTATWAEQSEPVVLAWLA